MKSTEKPAGLAYWANRTLEECDKAMHGFEPDPVHDLRVAIRRCRSMADGFIPLDPDPAWKQMKKLGRALFCSLGDLRDTQVMIDWVEKLSDPDDPLRGILSDTLRSREAVQKVKAQEALSSFDRKQWATLNTKLARRTNRVPPEGLVFQHLALERWTEARELHRKALRNRSSVAFHQLRIGLKRLRYTVENFLPERHARWGKDLRELQDALGEVHDFDVLWGLIKAHHEVPAQELAKWKNVILAERQKRIALYRRKMVGRDSLWLHWRKELPQGDALLQAALEKLRTWASFLDPDFKHAEHVTRLALTIFDRLENLGVLRSRRGRDILQAACIVHEVGRSKREQGHAKRAYRLVTKLKPPLPWNDRELREIGLVARYHRGALPDPHNGVHGIGRATFHTVVVLAGILRLANALDLDHRQSVTELAISRHDGHLLIRALGLEPGIGSAAERIARARYLLEAACHLPIMVVGENEGQAPSLQSATRPRK